MAACRSPSSPNLVNPYGFPVPANLFEAISISLQGPRGSAVGIRVNAGLVVLKVEQNSISEDRFKFADVITGFNGMHMENKQMFIDLLKKHIVDTPDSFFRVEINILRPICSLPMDHSRMPKDMKPLSGSKYRIGVIHFIQGCKLSLQIKPLNRKVYVTKITEETLASMALQVGDVILDVDSQSVASIGDPSEILVKNLKEKGYITMVLESPDDPPTKKFVRSIILSEKTQEIDLPMLPDVVEICKNELARFSSNPDRPPLKSINRELKRTPRPYSSRLKVSEQAEDTPIACEASLNLLDKVPPPPSKNSNYQSNYQSLASLNNNQKKW